MRHDDCNTVSYLNNRVQFQILHDAARSAWAAVQDDSVMPSFGRNLFVL